MKMFLEDFCPRIFPDPADQLKFTITFVQILNAGLSVDYANIHNVKTFLESSTDIIRGMRDGTEEVIDNIRSLPVRTSKETARRMKSPSQDYYDTDEG